MAYAYNGDVFVHSRWSSKKFGDKIKRKTSILIDQDGKMQAFGKDARARLCNDYQSSVVCLCLCLQHSHHDLCKQLYSVTSTEG